MEPLKKIVKNQYFPAAAVLAAVVLFWVIAMFGGLSLLNNNQPPMATLTWMLFVYAAAVLTPLAGVLAAVNLVRRWQRNRQYAQALAEAGVQEEIALADEPETALQPAADPITEPATDTVAVPEPASVQREQTRPAPKSRPAPKQPAINHQAAQHQPAQKHHAKSQPLKKPAQAKQRKKAA
jgi:hypothetical protein